MRLHGKRWMSNQLHWQNLFLVGLMFKNEENGNYFTFG